MEYYYDKEWFLMVEDSRNFFKRNSPLNWPPFTFIAIYIGLILIFWGVFAVLDCPFKDPETNPNNCLNSLYFSVVTITTLGYGDLTPVTTPAKLWAMIEVVLGVVLMGMFLTSISHRMSQKAKSQADAEIERKERYDLGNQLLAYRRKIDRRVTNYRAAATYLVEDWPIDRDQLYTSLFSPKKLKYLFDDFPKGNHSLPLNQSRLDYYKVTLNRMRHDLNEFMNSTVAANSISITLPINLERLITLCENSNAEAIISWFREQGKDERNLVQLKEKMSGYEINNSENFMFSYITESYSLNQILAFCNILNQIERDIDFVMEQIDSEVQGYFPGI